MGPDSASIRCLSHVGELKLDIIHSYILCTMVPNWRNWFLLQLLDLPSYVAYLENYRNAMCVLERLARAQPTRRYIEVCRCIYLIFPLNESFVALCMVLKPPFLRWQLSPRLAQGKYHFLRCWPSHCAHCRDMHNTWTSWYFLQTLITPMLRSYNSVLSE